MSAVATLATAVTTPYTGTFTPTGVTTVNGSHVITVGDVFVCAHHGASTVTTGSGTTKDLNGRFMARVGSHTACGETITTGDSKMELRT